jgi:hypothetical protein
LDNYQPIPEIISKIKWEQEIKGGYPMSQLNRIEQMLTDMHVKLQKLESKTAKREDLEPLEKKIAHLQEVTVKREDLKPLEEKIAHLQEVAAKQEDLLRLEEAMAKHEDLMRVAETLEYIAEESAAAVENKSEAGYVALESLFKGLENRLAAAKHELENRSRQGFDEVNNVLDTIFQLCVEQTEALNQMKIETNARFNTLSDIMRSWVYKQNLLDDELKKLKEQVEKLSDGK